MNENEIIKYLKENKTKGIAFGFMPEEVKAWCKSHKDESIFHIYYNDGWENLAITIEARQTGLYALSEDYEPKPEFKPHWEEFSINKDGMFFTIDDDGKICYYHWWNWVEFLNHHHAKFDDFGGWVYETSLSNGEKIEVLATSPHILEHGKDLSSFIILDGKNEAKPAYPTKILFWRYAE